VPKVVHLAPQLLLDRHMVVPELYELALQRLPPNRLLVALFHLIRELLLHLLQV